MEVDISERGNIWLMRTWSDEADCHQAWFHIENDRWLHVSVFPSDYPGLHVVTEHWSEEALAGHITETFGDDDTWIVRKMNLEGVRVTPELYPHVLGKDSSNGLE